jgi:hypothetical protein
LVERRFGSRSALYGLRKETSAPLWIMRSTLCEIHDLGFAKAQRWMGEVAVVHADFGRGGERIIELRTGLGYY